jgi:hypothetical protein
MRDPIHGAVAAGRTPWRPTEADRQGRGHCAGTVLGVVVLGAVDEPDPPEPAPPMFGQSAVEPPVCFGGVVDVPPFDGAVVLGADDGSGLAAETAAAAPPTRSSAEMPAVMTARRMPPVRVTCAGSMAGGGGCAGSTGLKT